jgi:ABC-type polysaccharide/polyol phosphate transport system ATPase subunit
VSARVVLEVEGISKKFARGFFGARRSALRDIWREIAVWNTSPRDRLHAAEFWALHEVSFALREGDALGIIGANGREERCSRSCRLLKPDKREDSAWGRSSGGPASTGALRSQNVFAQGALYGFGVRQMATTRAIVDFADIGEGIDKPVQHSGGMRAGLGFAWRCVDPQPCW